MTVRPRPFVILGLFILFLALKQKFSKDYDDSEFSNKDNNQPYDFSLSYERGGKPQGHAEKVNQQQGR